MSTLAARIAFVAALMAPAAARAQNAPAPAPVSDAEREQARLHFVEGVRLAEATQWNDAIRELEAARAIRPTAAVHFNLGLAYRAVGRSRDAITAFDAYLHGAAANDPRVEQVRGYLAALRTSIGRLALRVQPANATVQIDGAPSEGGTRELDPGEHVVVIEANGYRPQSRTVSIAPGRETPLEIALAAIETAPRLQVQSNVSTAAIVIDGQRVSYGSAEVELRPGRHSVDVRANGYLPFHGEVTLVASGTSRVSAVLTQERSVFGSPLLWGGAALVVGGVVAGVVFAMSNHANADFDGTYGHVSGAITGAH